MKRKPAVGAAVDRVPSNKRFDEPLSQKRLLSLSLCLIYFGSGSSPAPAAMGSPVGIQRLLGLTGIPPIPESSDFTRRPFPSGVGIKNSQPCEVFRARIEKPLPNTRRLFFQHKKFDFPARLSFDNAISKKTRFNHTRIIGNEARSPAPKVILAKVPKMLMGPSS